jgi:hypothetical protein
MSDPPPYPPLIVLHPASSLSAAKLVEVRRLAAEVLIASLLPGQKACLETRRDGTILERHHRIHVLRERGVELDRLPREIIAREVE